MDILTQANPSASVTPEAAAARGPFPGVITLNVDATDIERRIIRVQETIPVTGAGRMTLLYPKWLPGYHSPQAPIELLAGIVISAGGNRIRWKRDKVEVHAFSFDVPDGCDAVEVEFQFLSPTSTAQGRVMVTHEMLNLQWNTVILYPAGHASRDITVQADLVLPEGWHPACALDVARAEGGRTSFEPTPLDILVDSPVFAGLYFRQLELDPNGPIRMNIFGDSAELLAATPDQVGKLQGLVQQADRLFGSRAFDRYDFLLALSDELGSIGVEHHRSCETGTDPGFFTQWETSFSKRDVVAHEYVHAWNGKFRRGKDSWTPSFDRPIGNSLMWVYEGQTQYWGHVLSARAGLWTAQQGLEALAYTAATYDLRAGRSWRPMSDTTRDPIIAGRSPLPWTSWQRSEDYYSEGQLVWLEIDTRIRELSGDTASLDDFARRFFGVANGSFETLTYDFDEVIDTLNGVAPFDWKGLMIERLKSTEPGAPLGGLERGGYRLVYRETPSSFSANMDMLSGSANLIFSLGVMVTAQGVLNEVLWGGPAFDANLTAGSTIVAVNGRNFTTQELTRAITQAKDGAPITLLVQSGKRYRTVTVPYHDGLRYPHLEPIEGTRPRLDEIYAARAG